MAGTLYVVATPIGNLEDVTTRTLRILRKVALIAAEDTRRTAKLLTHYGITTRTTSLYAQNEARKLPALLRRLEAGDDLALVTDAGTPTVSDPGARLIAAAASRGVRVSPIPGPSAILAAISCAGFPADSFTFRGFPPRKSTARLQWLRAIAADPSVSVFFEAPHRARETLRQAASIFGNRPIAVARELTKLHEEIVRGPASEVVAQMSFWQGEFTIVIGTGDPHLSEIKATDTPADVDRLRSRFQQLTEFDGLSRREALSRVAREMGVRPNTAYRLLLG